MARAGMARHRGRNPGQTEGTDDVQRSLELLDRVLSEFDDIENANQTQQICNTGASETTNEADTTAVVVQDTGGIQVRSKSAGGNNVGGGGGNVSSTPEDESPSLGGHQSEDDGYMSMNGRKAKFTLSFKPVNEVTVQQEHPTLAENNMTNEAKTNSQMTDIQDFPPPPEEAERLIATLLPRVSPGNSAKRNSSRRNNTAVPSQAIVEITNGPQQQFNKRNLEHLVCGQRSGITAATQTTLPKTRHQRPYGWDKSETGFHLQPAPVPPRHRYASLPYDGRGPVSSLGSPTWMPPRTVPGAADRHREVCRRRLGSDENLTSTSDQDENVLRPLSELADDEHFSDDSLEESLPPPPPVCSKRNSIAWEVPLGLDDDPLLTPGSTKVVGRRRRKSGDQSHSSTSSIPNRLKDLDDWPDPPPCSTEDEIISPFSDSDEPIILPDELAGSDLSNSGTYVIRRGRKERKPLNHMSTSQNSNSSLNSRLSSDLSIPHSRFSVDLNSSRYSRELHTPCSRFSIDLSTPHSRLSQELNSPKSRYSLDLNNSRDSNSSRISSETNHSRSSTPQNRYNDKKHSTTFDNIKSLIKEGVIENYSPPLTETSPDFNCPPPPSLVRVVSLPTLNADDYQPRRELAVTVEEEEDVESPRQHSAEMSPLRKIEQNISELLERRDIDVLQLCKSDSRMVNGYGYDPKKHDIMNQRSLEDEIIPYNALPKPNEIQKSSSNVEIRKSEEYYRQILQQERNGAAPQKPKRNGIQKSESAKEMLLSHYQENEWPITTSNSADFPIKVEVLQHDFPPLPPSPVEEDEDEYQEILHPIQKKRADTLPASSDPPIIPPHREPVTNSLKTRSMDAGFSRGRRNVISGSGRQIPPERRTLPTELPGTRRRTFLKRSSQSPREEHHMQTSCSLPETPIFARGCDIPRTPHRRAPDVPGIGGSRTAPRQSSTMGTINTLSNMNTTGYRRGMSSTGLEQAIVGTELLRLAGGPGRGWYPKHRHPRPASIEHLDRLTHTSNPWDNTARKPLTLPPNLTPKFFQRSPREALRRVTSLLIRKGNNGKESKKDRGDVLSPSSQSANGEESGKKKGFFKNFWKRSRHYSLEQQ